MKPTLKPAIKRQCANSTAQHSCAAKPLDGHIFCDRCRIASGGLDLKPSGRGFSGVAARLHI
jgi:hypothetical protein